jgi:MraZ protein
LASFKGQYLASVDEKGRIAIPARLRGAAKAKKAQQFVLTKGMDGCLALYPNPEWKKIQTKKAEGMRGLPFTQKDFRFFDRNLSANAIDVIPDKQGRILIPTYLLQAGGIAREVLLIGVTERIELWNPEKYSKYLEDYGETIEQVAERLFSKIE